MNMVHELSKDKDCVVKYCASCHIILTGAGFKLHQNCESVFISDSFAGKKYCLSIKNQSGEKLIPSESRRFRDF